MNAKFAESVAQFLRAGAEMPDSGQFATNQHNREYVEADACLEALNWLQRHHGWANHRAFTQPDPPDVVFEMTDGRNVFFEFSIICLGDAIHRIKKIARSENNKPSVQNWSPEAFQREVRSAVDTKEQKFLRHMSAGLVKNPLVLVLGSDSAMSGLWLCDDLIVTSSIFDEILIHLGYPGNPDTTGSSDDPVVHPLIYDAKRGGVSSGFSNE